MDIILLVLVLVVVIEALAITFLSVKLYKEECELEWVMDCPQCRGGGLTPGSETDDCAYCFGRGWRLTEVGVAMVSILREIGFQKHEA